MWSVIEFSYTFGFLPLFLASGASAVFAFSISSSRSFLSNRVLPPMTTGLISSRSIIL